MNRKRRRGNGGLSIGGLIALIILLYFLKHFGWIFGLVLAVGAAALIFFIVRAVIRACRENQEPKKEPVNVKVQGAYPKPETKKPQQTVQKPAPQPKPDSQPTYSPEVQSIVNEGRRAHRELDHLYQTIPELSVKSKIRELIDVSDKIIQDAIDDPNDVPQIKKFLDYYLPTTIKLLNAYDRMGAQGIEGQNISGTMQSIEEMLDTAVAAYRKLLDSLFANQALDVETDIEVMNTLLKREGLTGQAGFASGTAAQSGAGKMTEEEK